MELLLHRLRSDPSLKKVTVSNRKEVFSKAYADNLTIIIQRDPATLRRIMDIVKAFQNVSGLAINVSKTVCINIGKHKTKQYFVPDLPIEFETKFKLLGIKFKWTSTETDQNFYDLTALLEQSMSFWGRQIFTPIWRIIALKTFILSKITDCAMVHPSPSKTWIFFLKKIRVQKTNPPLTCSN